MQEHYQLKPVYREISADIETPVSAFLALKTLSKRAFLLESVEMGERLGRYSFLGFEPELEFKAKGKEVEIRFRDEVIREEVSDPIESLRTLLARFEETTNENLPPFTAGLVGYFSYDSVRYFENIPDQNADHLNKPDIYLVLPKMLVAFDHIKQKLILITHTVEDSEESKAVELINRYEETLFKASAPARLQSSNRKKLDLISNFKKSDFIQAVEKARDYIVAGDIFQVVISQRLKTQVTLEPFEIYRKLRMINPSPYLFYFDFEDWQIIGSSPEVMVKRTRKAHQDEILLRPIAGTRPRGKNNKEDLAFEEDLLKDQKELAEHTMLLDLARNDVGRVSEFGSVKVERAFHIERYSHVMHIVSDVSGKPREGYDALDIIGSAFPAGTVSGSPKIRAMEIIDELEPEKRGVYAGAIGYIDFSGNTDTCITIRTIVHENGTAYLQAGAGIVYDSDPEKEYQETINKAKALMKAII